MYRILACLCVLMLFLFTTAPAQELHPKLWAPNTTVSMVHKHRNTLYLSGTFTNIGPVTGGGAALRASDGKIIHEGLPMTGSVYASVADGQGGWYIGGNFIDVKGYPRARLAHLLSNGEVDPLWRPAVNQWVSCLALRNGILYAGGNFTQAEGVARNYLAAFDARTGRLTPWNPNATILDGGRDFRYMFALTATESAVYAGGMFTNIGGKPRQYLAALDPITGAATDWNPAASYHVRDIEVYRGKVYVAGEFLGVGGQVRQGLAALDPVTGLADTWNPAADRNVYNLARQGDTLYVGGDFLSMGSTRRVGLAAFRLDTGELLPWSADVDNAWVWSLAVLGNVLYVGGDFTSIKGQQRERLAAVTTRTGELLPWNPYANNRVFSVSAAAGQVFAGGFFTAINCVSRRGLGAIDLVTGKATAWDPSEENINYSAILATDSVVYVGGTFSRLGGKPISNLAATDPVTGKATDWNPGAEGPIYKLAGANGQLYVAGGFYSMAGQPRRALAAFRAGQLTPWDPQANGYLTDMIATDSVVYVGGYFNAIGGQPRQNLASLDGVTGLPTTGLQLAVPSGVQNLVLDGKTMYLTGGFSTLDGQSRTRLAAVDLTTGRVTNWNPVLTNTGTPAALAVRKGLVYVGGYFTAVGGQPRRGIAAIDAVTAQPTPWDPAPRSLEGANDIWADDEHLLVGGSFEYVHQKFRPNVAAYAWQASPPGPKNIIAGTIYEGQPGDCDTPDGKRDKKPIPGVVVVAEPGPYYGRSDSLGNYYLAVDTGSYTLRQVLPGAKDRLLEQVCPNAATVRKVSFAAYGRLVTGQDFANVAAACAHVVVGVELPPLRICSEGQASVTYRNTGGGPAENLVLHLQLPPQMDWEGLRAAFPQGKQEGNAFVLPVGTLLPGASKTLFLPYKIPCRADLMRLTTCLKAWTTPANGCRAVLPTWDRSTVSVKARCAANGRVRLGIYNTGAGDMADSASFRVYLDARFTYTRRFRLAAGDSLMLQIPANGQTVRLEADQPVDHPYKRSANVTVEACGTNAQGKVSTGFLAQLPADDAEPEVSEACAMFTGSYDPNDKLVAPTGTTAEMYTPFGTELTYTVRFQNTGNDYAYQVVLVDTLPADLDVSSLEMETASHPYVLTLGGKHRPVATWTFNNIYLPDSARDPAGSNGFVRFRIAPKAGLAPKTRIENYADIFFDYNDPIRTNTVLNTLYDVPLEADPGAGRITVCQTNPAARAGNNRTVCGRDSVHLEAQPPAAGYGRWHKISGPGTLEQPGNPASPARGLGYGDNVFEWRIAANPCGTDSLGQRVTIHRLPEPQRPVIALESNNLLSCDVPGDGYRWYLDEAVLPAETARITPTGEGAYTVAVVRDGCWSEPSAPFAYRVTGMTTLPAGSIRMYPNPNAGRFRVQLPAAFTGPFSIRVVDLLGREVGHREYDSPGRAGEEWDLGSQPGNYFVIVQRQKTRYIQSLVIRP